MNCLILILISQYCAQFNAATVTTKQFRVLLWTPFFRKYSDWPQINNNTCKYRNCEITHDRDLVDTSDAVIFHWRDIDVKDLLYHKPNQTWILFNLESPHHTPIDTVVPLVDQINWTMTYRHDSDIFVPYGEIVKCDNSGYKIRNGFSEKIKSAAWVASNCDTKSKREQYVDELKKYIDVKVYGLCGDKLGCPRDESCWQRIAKQYKFYLSFENSICKDYVTEKLFNLISKYDIIPVVLGGADYSAIMPYNSYIDAFNFSSPKHLAEYLHVVGSDPIKYNSYMSWKQNHCSVMTDYMCKMCERLNNPQFVAKTTNFTDWWFRGGNCTIGVSYSRTLPTNSSVLSLEKIVLYFIILYYNLKTL